MGIDDTFGTTSGAGGVEEGDGVLGEEGSGLRRELSRTGVVK